MIAAQAMDVARKRRKPRPRENGSTRTHDTIDHAEVIWVGTCRSFGVIPQYSNVPAVPHKGVPGRVLRAALDSELIFTGFLVRPAALADAVRIISSQINQSASRDDRRPAEILHNFTSAYFNCFELEVASPDMERVERAVVT